MSKKAAKEHNLRSNPQVLICPSSPPKITKVKRSPPPPPRLLPKDVCQATVVAHTTINLTSEPLDAGVLGIPWSEIYIPCECHGDYTKVPYHPVGSFLIPFACWPAHWKLVAHRNEMTQQERNQVNEKMFRRQQEVLKQNKKVIESDISEKKKLILQTSNFFIEMY
jgi:hypothetical protein